VLTYGSQYFVLLSHNERRVWIYGNNSVPMSFLHRSNDGALCCRDYFGKVMKLSVVIVNYNVRVYLDQCLRSLQFSLRGVDAEVIVVDNHSRDDSVEWIRGHFPWVKVIANQHNLGFACANNMAIKECKGEYVLLLNPDTIVGDTTIRECLDFLALHPDAGALGVRMLHTDGTDAPESRRGVPSPMTSFYKMIGLCSKYPHHPRFAHYYMSGISWDKPAKIEIVSGAFCMLRKCALDQVGLLDEDFFMYGEDIDLSYRLLKGGWQNYYLPALILHYKGESTQKSSFRYVHVFYEAMLIFLRKHYPSLRFMFVLPVRAIISVKAFFVLCQMVNTYIRKSLGFRVSLPKRSVRPLEFDASIMGYGDMLRVLKDSDHSRTISIKYDDYTIEG
jgi:GT2 family glycosyltransferase